MKHKIKIMVAETGELMCAGIGTMLKQQADMVLLGEAKSKHEIILKCQDEDEPELLLLAQNIPCPSLPSLIGEIKALYPSVKILILTSERDMAVVQATLKADAEGYVLSDEPIATVLSAIRAVARGEGWLSPSLGAKLLVKDKALPQLSAQKQQILRHIAAGASNQEIATRLQIGKRTVSYHLRQIYDVLKVDSRAQATRVAYQMNLL